ncbi:MAG: site-specific DNA-methyltransferase [Proteobacteria bacterium]|nr:site-specific DNA-methyltransferase [Pseudomonadota bacterium]
MRYWDSLIELSRCQFHNQVLSGDALSVLSDMRDGMVDMTITSPPYNKGEQGAVLIKAVKYDTHRDNMPEAEYQNNQIKVLNEIYRVTKSGGSCFYNHRPRWVKGKPIHPFEWLSKTKWQMRQHIIWHRKICGNIRAWRFYQTHEEIWWLWKPNGKSPGQNQINMEQATLGSVWPIFPYKNKSVKHPCLFPPEIPARAILATTKKGDTVLDPYVGCGTTIMAAHQLGRNYIGIDISETYAEIARKRIKVPFDGDVKKVEEERSRVIEHDWRK